MLPNTLGYAEISVFCIVASATLFTLAKLRIDNAKLPGWAVFILASVGPFGVTYVISRISISYIFTISSTIIAISLPVGAALAVSSLLVVGESLE
jgi:hypothetical protein